jgi:hypothetical protein
MQRPPLEMNGGLAASLKKGSKIFDPLLEKQISILLFEKERNLPFSN